MVCSTPFGIKDQITYPGPARPSADQVLNAFRHQRSDHSATPSPGATSRRAQRLSASKIRSRKSPGNFRTVYGVLNAFRHQRSDHMPPASPPAPPMSAQRLSASKIRSPLTPLRAEPPISSAQRLSASKIRSRTRNAVGLGGRGCSTPFGIKDQITRFWKVISLAMRSAQRLSASKIRSREDIKGMGFGTDVLNAFRHQRSDHASSTRAWRGSTGCSTPFGIKDQITQMMIRRIDIVLSAQRLSASKIRSLLLGILLLEG